MNAPSITIPRLFPRKYHHEIQCLLNECATKVHRMALAEIKGDDDFERVANLDSGFKTAPIGLLASLAKRGDSPVSARLHAIRMSKKEVAE